MKLVKRMFVMSIKKQAEYKLNFILLCIAVAPIHLIQALFSWIIATKYSGFSGWSAAELIFLYGMLLTSYSFAQVFFRQFRYIDSLIVGGELDICYIRPQSLLFTLSFSNIRVMEIISQLLPSMVILIVSAVRLHITWCVAKVLILIGGLVGGFIIQSCIFIIIGLISFWTVKSSGLEEIYYSVKDFMNYPIEIYSDRIIALVTYIIPIAFANYYPARFILEKEGGELLINLLTIPVSIVIAAITICLWVYATKRYSSSGS